MRLRLVLLWLLTLVLLGGCPADEPSPEPEPPRPAPPTPLQLNEQQAIATLREIHRAQEEFRLEDAEDNGSFDYARDLTALVEHHLIDRSVLEENVETGYRFRLQSFSPYAWLGYARPIIPGVTGRRYFKIDADGQVWQSLEDHERNVSWQPVE